MCLLFFQFFPLFSVGYYPLNDDIHDAIQMQYLLSLNAFPFENKKSSELPIWF